MQNYTNFFGVNWFNLIQIGSIWFSGCNALNVYRYYGAVRTNWA